MVIQPLNFIQNDGHANTLTVIKSTNNRIFGGFTSLSYHSLNGQYYYDSNAFIFSLNNLEVYEVNKKENSVWIGSSYSIIFGSGHDIFCKINVYLTPKIVQFKLVIIIKEKVMV